MAFATRFALYLFVITMIGSVSFALVVVTLAITDPGRRAELRGQTARLGQFAALLLLPVMLSRLYLQLDAMRFAGEPLSQSLAPLMTGTLWGSAWVMQLAGALCAALAFRLVRVLRRVEWLWLSAVAVMLVALTLPLSGHAASAKVFRPVAIMADFLHVMGAGTWLGTLGVLLVTVLARRREGDEAAAAGERRAAVRAFSPIALVCAATVAASGLFATVLHVHSLHELLSSNYGRVLLFKLGAVGTVLLLGFLNWKRNTARIAEDGGASIRSGALRELVAAALVLLITSSLVVTPPPP